MNSNSVNAKKNCRYGTECRRRNCYFNHPDGKDINNNKNNNKNNNRNNRRKKNEKNETEIEIPKTDIDLFDIGANLTNYRFKKDLNKILQDSFDNNIKTIIITGTSEKASVDALNLIEKFHDDELVSLYSTCGVHPHDSKHYTDQTDEKLRQLIANNQGKIISVGECGLDFNRMHSTQDEQETCFRKQLSIAEELQLPLFCHEREAHERFVEITDEFNNLPKLVVHCFTGILEEIEVYLEKGFYVGFTGTICMKERGQHLRDILSSKVIPIERIMIETDCPFMTPIKIKTRRNEPKYLPFILKTISECYELELEEVAEIIKNTTKEFFQI
eukprot:TRINITY_DN8470_c0_g1_i1.p1 TRINITY_DN8470_c0_g1~~TRINITY_DN8470_c0_g1_i1.p1  ORF type:complete len:330 (-),score=93.88 TRINITY_DN8470_c0_g1_i1:80-1069(-)